jgi:hypothetical protein
MAQMCPTGAAVDLGPSHKPVGIGLGLDRIARERLKEAWPSRPGIELGARAEQWSAAAYADIDAVFSFVDVLAGKWALSAMLARHLILFGGELLGPLLRGFLYLLI